jgi:hypothetical protein
MQLTQPQVCEARRANLTNWFWGARAQGPQAVAVAVCSALVRLPDIAASDMLVEKVRVRRLRSARGTREKHLTRLPLQG